MAKIKYSVELFDILKDLSSINQNVVFQKNDEGQIIIRRADSESTIAYELRAPSDFFDFGNDTVAFYNYPEFYQYFKALGEPEMAISENKITLIVGNSKTGYLLSNPETISEGPKSINFKDPDVKINLSSAELDELLKMIGLINSKKTQVIGNGESITFKVFHNLHDNTFEKTFKVENLSDFKEEIDFVMFSETFKNLPPKRDYTIEIKSQGFIKISLVDEKIGLDIYTGRVKN
jgi:hypothetical protein